MESLPAAIEKELEITLDTALMLSPDTPIPALAERIYNSEAGLVEHVQRPWVVERFIWLLYRRRRKVIAARQLMLPGFENLPGRLVMDDGRWVQLAQAGLEELKHYRTALRKRYQGALKRDPRLDQMERLIALVRRHPGKKVYEVMAAEQAKLDFGQDHDG